MTKLNLLGAQRVKALTEIMERKYKDAISEVRNDSLTEMEAVKVYSEKLGGDSVLREAEDLRNKLNELKPDLRKIGVTVRTDLEVNFFNMSNDLRDKLREIRNNGTEERVAKLNRDLEERKSQLWLVETLEQAQEIVNRPIE